MPRIRILAAVILDDQRHAPDSLLDVSAELAVQLISAGDADDHPDAVAWCLEQGITPIAIGTADPAAVNPEKPAKTTRRKAAPKE